MQTLKSKFLNIYTDDSFFLKLLSVFLYPNTNNAFNVNNINHIKSFFSTIEKDVSYLKPNKFKDIKQVFNLFFNILDSKNSSINIVITHDNIMNYINIDNNYIQSLFRSHEKINDDMEFATKYNNFLKEIELYNYLKSADSEIENLDKLLFNDDSTDIISTVDVLKKSIETLYYDFSEISTSNIEDKKNNDFWYIDDNSFDIVANDTTSYLSDEYINFKTGISLIDDNIYGLMSSKLYLIAAPSNHGKSVLMVDLLYGICKNNQEIFSKDKKDVIILYVLEDDKYEVQSKIISVFGNINSSTVSNFNFFFNDNKDNISHRNEFNIFFNKLLKQTISPVLNGNINILIKEREEGTTSISDITQDIEQLKHQGYNIKGVLIDYLEAMVPILNSNQGEYENQGQIVKETRRTARQYKIPIVIATQLNRYASDPSTVLNGTTLADSKKKKDYSDFIIIFRQRPDIELYLIGDNGILKNLKNMDFTQISGKKQKNPSLIPIEIVIDKAKKGKTTESKFLIMTKDNLRISYIEQSYTDLEENKVNTQSVLKQFNQIYNNTNINITSLNF